MSVRRLAPSLPRPPPRVSNFLPPTARGGAPAPALWCSALVISLTPSAPSSCCARRSALEASVRAVPSRPMRARGTADGRGGTAATHARSRRPVRDARPERAAQLLVPAARSLWLWPTLCNSASSPLPPCPLCPWCGDPALPGSLRGSPCTGGRCWEPGTAWRDGASSSAFGSVALGVPSSELIFPPSVSVPGAASRHPPGDRATSMPGDRVGRRQRGCRTWQPRPRRPAERLPGGGRRRGGWVLRVRPPSTGASLRVSA